MRIIYNGIIEEFDRIEFKEAECLTYGTSNQWYALYCSKNGKMSMIAVVKSKELHQLMYEGFLRQDMNRRFVYPVDSERFLQDWKIIESNDR